MIVYTYPGRITDKQEIQSIKDFAKSHRLKLISIGHYFSWCDDVVIPSPLKYWHISRMRHILLLIHFMVVYFLSNIIRLLHNHTKYEQSKIKLSVETISLGV